MTKIYVGSGKSFGQYGDISISICISDIDKDKFQTAKSGKKYLNIVCSKRKEKGKFGETHTIYLNEWKPENNEQETPF